MEPTGVCCLPGQLYASVGLSLHIAQAHARSAAQERFGKYCLQSCAEHQLMLTAAALHDMSMRAVHVRCSVLITCS